MSDEAELVKGLGQFIERALLGEPPQVAVLACVDAAVRVLLAEHPEWTGKEALDALAMILSQARKLDEPNPDAFGVLCRHGLEHDKCDECRAELVKGGVP